MKIIDWSKYDKILGTESDVKIAEIIGCHKRTVARRRKEINCAPAYPQYDNTGFWKSITAQPDSSAEEASKHPE